MAARGHPRPPWPPDVIDAQTDAMIAAEPVGRGARSPGPAPARAVRPIRRSTRRPPQPLCAAVVQHDGPRQPPRPRNGLMRSSPVATTCSAIASLSVCRRRRPRRLASRPGAPAHARRFASGRTFPTSIPPSGDHKIIWELNRHQHWLRLGRALWLTGDARYGDAHHRRTAAAGSKRIRRSSASTGRACSSSASGRCRGSGDCTSCWDPIPHSLIPDPRSPIPIRRSPWLVDMFVALDRQLTHVEQNLSTTSARTRTSPARRWRCTSRASRCRSSPASRRWRDTGRRILLEEIDRQMLADGGHAERSTHYHRYTLDFYLMALLTARRDGDRRRRAPVRGRGRPARGVRSRDGRRRKGACR